MDAAQLIFAGFEQHMRRAVPTVADIKCEVAHYFRIPAAEMVSDRRARAVARPRQVAMYLARLRTPKSLPNIGKLFGHRDHTTVIHAVRQIERLICTDAALASAVRELDGRI